MCHKIRNAGPRGTHGNPVLTAYHDLWGAQVAGIRLDDGSLEAPDHAVYGKGWRNVLFAPGCVTDKSWMVNTAVGPVFMLQNTQYNVVRPRTLA